MGRWFFGLAALGAVFVGWLLALEACSLSIDETAINDAGTDAFAPPVVECFGPKDCKSSDPCVTPRCDTATQQCVFEVCPTGDKCSAISCTTIQTCGRVAPFGFQAGNFAIPEGLACPSCIGAVFPYLFVVTNLRLHAYRVSDPTNPVPPEISISDLGFTPRAVVTSGRRVYFIGGPSGTVSPYKLQVSWVDAPADVGITSIRVHESALPFPSPDFRFDGIIAGPDDELFPLHRVTSYENNMTVVRDQELLMHVTATPDPTQLNFVLPMNYPANGHTVAFTNARLAVYRSNMGVGSWSFDAPPGVSASTNSGDTPLPLFGTPGASTFAQTSDGAVYWAAALRAPPMQNMPQLITGVRLAAPLGDPAGAFAIGMPVDVETYAAGQQENNGQPNPNPYVGPIVPIGSTTALVLAAARENTSQTSVQLVTRAGGNLTLGPGRFVTTARVDAVAAAGTDRFAYVADPQTADSMIVHIFSAECP